MYVPDEIIKTIEQNQSFTVTSHINPEGDALGASIALALSLRALGKDVFVYNRDGVPAIYRFLPYSELIHSSIDNEYLKQSVLFILDCNDLDRVGLKDCSYNRALIIDHHQTESDFGDVRWIDPTSPATGLMIYYLLKRLGVDINEAIATNLYVALAIDTGTFRFENTTAEALRVASELMEAGANSSDISIRLYESWSLQRFNLLITTLQTLDIVETQQLSVAIMTITRDQFRQTGTTAADTENFSNFPRQIDSVDISVLFREVDPGLWKASMRSKSDVNVSRIASHFDGGGHRNAAGYIVKGTIQEIKQELIDAIKLLKLSGPRSEPPSKR
jgi:phosphoesterase RecJ-like protein